MLFDPDVHERLIEDVWDPDRVRAAIREIAEDAEGSFDDGWPTHPKDIEDTANLLRRLQPAQVYVAGEMSDPHGTHRTCAEIVFQAVRAARAEGQQFEVWLYRGAWEEWEPHELERVVPLSPTDVERKKLAIFRHQSQKDRAMFPGGADQREFWQRAEDRNIHTAKVYDQLGLPEFYALEGFVQWRDE